MEISEVRVKLVTGGDERLRAFCSVTLDGCFVIRDLKVIDGIGGPFVAMPSRKLTDRCPQCGGKNHLRAQFCNDCGGRLRENRAMRDAEGRVKLHADVAHPIKPECRERIQHAIVAAYEEEIEASKQPGYRPSLDDDEFGTSDFEEMRSEPTATSAPSADFAVDLDHPQPPPLTTDKAAAEKTGQWAAAEGADSFGAGIL